MGEETEALIEKVRKYEYLYDTSHELYRNVTKKAHAWTEIAAEFNITSHSAKFKWKNLRDCYLRYKKSSKGVTGQAKKYRKWPWRSHMQFIDDTLKSRSRTSNVQTAVDVEDSTPPAANTPSPIEVTERSDRDASKMLPPLPRKKLKLAREVDKVVDFLQSDQSKRDCDGIDHLFLSYADTFRKFQPMTQAVLKIELATLFARTEMKELGTPLYSENSSSSSATQFPVIE